MSKQVIQLGAAPTGVGGDTPRSANIKAIANFDEIYAALGATGSPATIPGALPVTQGGTGGNSQVTARTGLGLGGAAVLDVGTAANTVAAGNDSRVVGSAQTNSAANFATVRLSNATTLSSSGGYFIPSSILSPPGYRSSDGKTSTSSAWNLNWASGMQVWVDGTYTGTIQYAASDARIKEEIDYVGDLAGDLAMVETLRPVTYRFAERGAVDRSALKRGLIAQDVMASDSALVTGEVIEGETKDNITSILSLDSLGLISYLIGAVQQLSAQNKAFEERLGALEQNR